MACRIGLESSADSGYWGSNLYGQLKMLAWMDLEMTGLDPAADVIVEIATLITDDKLELVAEGPDLVVYAPPEALASMEDVVVEMHTKSGLLNEIKASALSLEAAGEMTLAFLKEHIDKPRSVPLCGNSIGVDRRFLAAQLPEIENFLHYRSIDVSTVKELARRWNTAAFQKAPTKAQGHRALDDIRESLNELRHYRDTFFAIPIESGPTEAGPAEAGPAEAGPAEAGK